MADLMPCHISDGPETPEDVIEMIEVDPDVAYDMQRMQELDDKIREAFMIPQHLLDRICTDPHELADIREEQHHD